MIQVLYCANKLSESVHGLQLHCCRPRQHPVPCRRLPSVTLTSTLDCGQTPATLATTLPLCEQQWATFCQSSLRSSPRPCRSL